MGKINQHSVAAALIAGMAFFSPAPAFSRPPSELNLDYDAQHKVLKVLIHHTTEDPQEHYIRRILVTKNQEEPRKFSYNRQPSNQEFLVELSLEMGSKDQVVVKAICSKAGTKEASLTLP